MTNKTREKLEDRKTKIIREIFEIVGFDYNTGFLDEKLLLLRVIDKIENRILRKWKKAMEKSLTSEWVVDYLSKRIMNSEYLKAKKEIEG